jgi:RimJ/RimL family protein N-acetyltransferase
VEALTSRALSADTVQCVIAHTMDSNTSSQRVLRRCGFVPAGPGAEPGLIRFERARRP